MMFIAINFMCKASLKPISSIALATGPQLEGWRWGRALPPAFRTFVAKDMSLNRGTSHFTLELRSCIISSFLFQIYLRLAQN